VSGESTEAFIKHLKGPVPHVTHREPNFLGVRHARGSSCRALLSTGGAGATWTDYDEGRDSTFGRCR
jgi:hypothetical protein